MATNVTPQYKSAEEEYRRAATSDDELKWLQVMLKEVPKHKASEKLQSDIKQRIAKVKKQLEVESKTPKKSVGVRIPRQGAGTVVLLGGPNAGKSSLLAKVTRATPEIAEYPFTTRQPLPGMMPWEDVSVQLIDLPPITGDFMEPYILNLVRGADLALFLVDLGSDEGLEAAQAALARFSDSKTQLGPETRLDEEDMGLSFTQTFVVLTHMDQPDAQERLELWHELCPLNWKEYPVSLTTGDGVEALRDAIYQALDVVRVYTKTPSAKQADYEKPYVLRRGGTVLDVAAMVHNDLKDSFKHARVWGEKVQGVITVKGDYVVHDKDVVELHT